MMLIIADKSPDKAVDYLVEHTNKNFVFKSLLELAQLICSCGISNVYKPVKQGKELQRWIREHIFWTYSYFSHLFIWCSENIKLKEKSKQKLLKIAKDLKSILLENRMLFTIWITTTIFRYKQGYKCEYESNSELPIDVAVNEYRKYLDWKFKKSEV